MVADTDFRIYTRCEVDAMSESEKVVCILQLQDAVVRLSGLCQSLMARNETLLDRDRNLEQRVKELEARQNQNSGNGSKPPSSDGLGKRPVRNLREKSGRKRGGQRGHKGTTLRQVETPDRVEKHAPGPCSCGHVFGGEEPERIERYRVFDIPEPRALVTEHRVEIACCPDCGRVCRDVASGRVRCAGAVWSGRPGACGVSTGVSVASLRADQSVV